MVLSWLSSTICVLLLGVGSSTARSIDKGLSMDLPSPLKSVSFHRTTAMRAPSVDGPAVHYQEIKPIKGKTASRSAAGALQAARSRTPGSGYYQNITALLDGSTQYALQVEWDDQPLWLLFDTGSSDTFAVRANHSCVSQFGGPVDSVENCAWGPDLVEDFRYGEDPQLHFKVRYGSGEIISGPLGRSDISIAGITVEKQLCGLANHTYWKGNNITNGMLGLAYPALTSAYSGPVDDERTAYKKSYSPFFSTMVSQGLVDPFFAVTIERNSSAGMIGWGGIPPVRWSGRTAAYTDILIANVGAVDEPLGFQYSFYTIVVDGIQYGHATDFTKYLYIVDTGTTLMYLPRSLADAIAHSFEPAAVYMWQYDSYFAPCDAVAPRLAVIINGAHFWINPADLIYQGLKEPTFDLCLLGIANGGDGPYILGSVFLQNVLAVFDVGGAQMRFRRFRSFLLRNRSRNKEEGQMISQAGFGRRGSPCR